MADTEFIRFKQLLKNNGHFATAPRMRLFGILQKRPALTFKQLANIEKMHDLVTLYRNIDLFEKLGVINKLRLGWDTKIELSDIFKHHHHHMTCLNCGRVFNLPENHLIENQINLMSQSQNFNLTDHQLEIRGLCKHCNADKNDPGKKPGSLEASHFQ